MIILRKGTKDNWSYTDEKGNKVTDKETLEYIKKLVIPPAYRDVQIFYEKNKNVKMLYLGYDSKNRLQQIYSKEWREKADKKKFISLIKFGKLLPKMIITMLDNIKSTDPDNYKNKIISIILRITSLCGFRIGQLKYHKLYNSVGLSTLQKKHLNFKDGSLEIKFVGKKSMLNECIVEDKIIIDELKKISKDLKPDDFIFKYRDDLSGDIKLINAIDVNNWLKEYDPEFTTKYFRTFEINLILINSLKNMPDLISSTENKRKKKIVEVMKEISSSINNTPAICKKSYINSELLKMYIEQPKKFSKFFIENANTTHLNFIQFLEATYKV